MNPKEFKDYLIKSVYKPLFKKNGFLVSGMNFRKEEEGFIKVFNIQSSQFNTTGYSAYYLNLGLFFPHSYPLSFSSDFWGGEVPEIPKSPKISHCQFNERSSDLFVNRMIYTIDSQTDQVGFERAVIDEINKNIIPFFENLASLNDCDEFLTQWRGNDNHRMKIALGYAGIGQKERAAAIIDKELFKNDNYPLSFRKALKRECEKLGLPGYDFLVKDESSKDDIDIDWSKGGYP